MRKFCKRVVNFDTTSVCATTNFGVKGNADEFVTADVVQGKIDGKLTATDRFSRLGNDKPIRKIFGIDGQLYVATATQLCKMSSGHMYVLLENDDGLVVNDWWYLPQSCTLYAATNRGVYAIADGQSRLVVGLVATALCTIGKQLLCAVGNTLHFSAADSDDFSDGNTGSVAFDGKITALHANGNSVLVFANGKVFRFTPSLCGEDSVCKFVASGVGQVSYAIDYLDKTYLFTSVGLRCLSNVSKEYPFSLGNVANCVCNPVVIDGVIYFADGQRVVGFTPQFDVVSVTESTCSSIAETADGLYGCDGNHLYQIKDVDGGAQWKSQLCNFSKNGKKYIRKISVDGVGKGTVRLKSEFGNRIVNFDCGERGGVVSVPCYLVGELFTLFVYCNAGCLVNSVTVGAVVYSKNATVS